MHTRTSHNWKTVPGSFDRLNTFRLYSSTHPAGIPDLLYQKSEFPTWLVPFNHRIRSEQGYEGGSIHFFLDDYRFESVWTTPDKAIQRLHEAYTVLTPDFSVYPEWPQILQVYNVYRSRWLGRYWQELGLTVVPTVTWGDHSSFDFAFSGIPKGMPIAISSMSVVTEIREQYLDGFKLALDIINPEFIICYGKPIDECMHLDNIRFYPTFWASLKEGRRNSYGRTWEEIRNQEASRNTKGAKGKKDT
mgnify:CR=1 FL=1